MTHYRTATGLFAAGALIAATGAAAQQPALPPTVQDEASMGCPAPGVEMGRAAQQLAQAGAPASSAPVAATAALSPLEEAGRAYQAQQNSQQLANLQVLAAQGGVDRGAATAAIGGVAALQQVAANGGNVQDAARAVAGDTVGNELAKRLPGGKLIGGMMGGFFKKEKAVVAPAPAAPAASLAQTRLTYLGAFYQAKGCR